MRHPSLSFFVGFGVLAAFLLWPAAGVCAGTPISLQEALRMAREKNPTLAAAREANNAAAEDVKKARAAFLPEAGFYTGFQGTNQPVSAFGMKLNQGIIETRDFDPRLLNHPEGIENFQLGFRFRQPLFTGGRTHWAYRAAKLGNDAAARETLDTENRVLFEVVKAYLEALHARQEVKLLEESVRLAAGLRDKIRNMYDQGMVTRADLLLAAVRLSNLEHDRLTARHSVAVADTALATAVGVGGSEVFEPTDVLETPAEGSEDEAAWIEKALAERPDLQSMELRIGQAQAASRIARGAFLPGVSLAGGYEWNDDGFFSDPNGAYTVGVEVGLTLFAGGGRAADLDKSKAEAARLRAMAEALRQRIRLQVENSIKDMEMARGQYRVAELAVSQAEEALRIISDRYETGLTDVVPLLRAEVELTDAKVRRARALYGFHTAQAMLRQSAGLPPGE
jgi:outer membrane protein